MITREIELSFFIFLQDSVVGNPIHAYKMMKRFAVDLTRIEKDMKDDDWESKNNSNSNIIPS